MALWSYLKDKFSKKIETEHELTAKLALIKVVQDTHTYTLADLLENIEKNEDFQHLVASAVAHVDKRIKDLEEKTEFLFKFASQHEERLDKIEERNNSIDLDDLVSNATTDSSQN